MHIDKNEVLRYLAYSGQVMDEEMQHLIESCIEESEKTARPLYLYEFFEITRSEQGIVLKDTNVVLINNAIKKHLAHCNKIAVLAATLGSQADRLIRVSQKTDIVKAVILDACANEYIEKVCDKACDEIKTKALSDGLFTTSRFSPGYGDLPLTLQKPILDLLIAYKKIGLTVTKEHILIPRKSVTAIVGLSDKPEDGTCFKSCDNCSKAQDCIYRKAGKSCGDNEIPL